MSIKMTGAELHAFWKADWSPFGGFSQACAEDYALRVDGEYFDDINGMDAIRPEQKVILEGGYVEDDSLRSATERQASEVSLEAIFRRWRKAQTTCILVIEVPKNVSADDVRNALKSIGGKIAS